MNDENLWGDDTFNDMPDEAQLDENGRPKQSPPVQMARPKAPPVVQQPPQEVEELAEEVFEEADSEEDFSEVLTDASLRLEQGTLYKLIMNHSLFEGVDADPKAVQNVQKEIRKFARERMEIMLGMRQESSTVEHLEINFPFNSLEVTTLKALARAATKGATDHSESFVPGITRTTEEVPTVSRRTTLNPISSPAPKKAAPQQTKKPLQSKASAPLKRSKLDITIDQIAREEGIPRELLEEDLKGMGGKALHELNETELLERNKIAAQRRGTQVRSAQALPMATHEQQEMMAIQRATQVAGGTPLMAQILDAVKKMPIKQ